LQPVRSGLFYTLDHFLHGTRPLEALVAAASDKVALRRLRRPEATAIASALDAVRSSDCGTAKVIAYVLVLAVEAIAEGEGHYGSEEAATINDAVESVFADHGLRLEVARCRLFRAHHLAARSEYLAALAATSDVPDELRAWGETYALACALLLRAYCRLAARGDRSVAADELSEAMVLFTDHRDERRVQTCRSILDRFHLGTTVH
jgi:hypothetical protein